jgi:hypothetical protein
VTLISPFVRIVPTCAVYVLLWISNLTRPWYSGSPSGALMLTESTSRALISNRSAIDFGSRNQALRS